MKRTLMLGVAAAAIGVLAMPTESYAQRRGGGFGGARGYGGNGPTINFGSGYGVNSNGLYGPGFGNSGQAGQAYGNGYNNGYGSDRGYYDNGYRGGYYNSNPGYIYNEPGTVYSQPSVNYSYYPPADGGSVQTNANYGAAGTIVVYVPANAQLWWGTTATSTTGVERRFATSALSPQGEVNTFQAQWRDANGQMHSQTRQVRAMPGQTVAVDFRQPVQNAQPQQAVTPNRNVAPQQAVPQPNVIPNQNAQPNPNVPSPNVPNRPNTNVNPTRPVNPDEAPPEPIR